MFNSTEYDKLKGSLERDYTEYLLNLRENLDEISKISNFSDFFANEINKILIDPELNSLSSINFYWLQLFNDLLFLNDLIEDEEEELIFDYFTDSEYSKEFLEEINNSTSIDLAPKYFSRIEDQIIAFYQIHIAINSDFSINCRYTSIPEIGDSEYISVPKKEIQFKFSKKLNELEKASKYKFLKVEDKLIIPRDSFDPVKIDDQSSKIKIAKDKIKKHSPFSYHSWSKFTEAIIPINEDSIVSYSIQELPGYSLINMWSRDNVDLLDDLIHENGHHYLNYHLNQKELILEDDELIFYSPWRKSKRTIRGLYHAYLTFFWAYKLFGDLCLSESLNDDFTETEINKIQKRFNEESQYLSEAQIELEKAAELGKITEEGLELLEAFEEAFIFSDDQLYKISSL